MYLDSYISIRSRQRKGSAALFLASFLTFGGYYVVLTLVSNGIIPTPSRYTSVLARLIIVFIIFIHFYKFRMGGSRLELLFFIVFAVCYILRILYEMAFGGNVYSITETEFLLYFLSFTVFPVYMLSSSVFSDRHYRYIFFGVIVGSILLSVVTILFYRDFIGSGHRLTKYVKLDDNYISPLALSYTAVLGMGVGIFYLMANKSDKFAGSIIVCCLLFSLVPFFLGASRGSLIALLLPFFIFLISLKGIKLRLIIIAAFFLGVAIMYFSSLYFGDAVFMRFLSIRSDVDAGSSSAVRAMVWEGAFEEFLEYPIFGSGLESRISNHHPHNILVESLIATGIVGSIPFFIFLFFCFYKSIEVARYQPRMFWIPVIFLQGFAQNMFSGAIYGASWLAFGAGLLLSLKNFKPGLKC